MTPATLSVEKRAYLYSDYQLTLVTTPDTLSVATQIHLYSEHQLSLVTTPTTLSVQNESIFKENTRLHW